MNNNAMIKVVGYNDTEYSVLHEIYEIAIKNIKKVLRDREHLNFNELLNDVIEPILTDAVSIVTESEMLKSSDVIVYANPRVFANEMLYDKSIIGYGEMIISESFNYYVALKHDGNHN